MLGNLSGYHLILLLLIVGVLIPWIFVALAAKRRRELVARGELVLNDRTNNLAVLGFVLSFFVAIPAVVLSHIALSQIKRTNDRGWGLAVAGLWIGYVAIGATTLFFVVQAIVGIVVKGS